MTNVLTGPFSVGNSGWTIEAEPGQGWIVRNKQGYYRGAFPSREYAEAMAPMLILVQKALGDPYKLPRRKNK